MAQQARPAIVTTLAITLVLGGLYLVVFELLGLTGLMPIQFQVSTTISGISIEIAKALALALIAVLALSLLVSAYGLYTQKGWGVWLTVIIITIELLAQINRKSIISFITLEVGSWKGTIDFGVLLVFVLLIAVLSLRPARNSLPIGSSSEHQAPQESDSADEKLS